MQILAKNAGIYGMIGGQVVDIQSKDKLASIETVNFIHTMKCGSLIESEMMICSILAGATEKKQAIIYSIASDVGLAF